MGQNLKMTTHLCSCCKLELPMENFYVNKLNRRPDNYCKKCRRNRVDSRWRSKVDSQMKNDSTDRIVITQVENKQERMRLILHALEVVNESIERKKQRIAEIEMEAMVLDA